MLTVQDKYNPIKRWSIKREASGKLVYSQHILNTRIYPYMRTTKKFLIHLGIVTKEQLSTI